MEKEVKFEQAIAQLGEIVKTLENGEAPLDKAIALFEEGMKLSKHCTEILEHAEQKVRFLQEQAEQTTDEC